MRLQVLLGSKYVNSQTLSDVTFIVEGKPFYAHRIALLASSEIFHSMFDGHYREKSASEIPIPNIRYEVFEAMMHCIYTGEGQAWGGQGSSLRQEFVWLPTNAIWPF